ncbi:MAG: sigma-70 family RNA polymerase sigma factor [Pseudomonadota bacterium]
MSITPQLNSEKAQRAPIVATVSSPRPGDESGNAKAGRPTIAVSNKRDPWDRLLVAVAEHADRDAFGQLFLHFAPRVKAYLFKLGSDAAQAEDLMQDVMAQVWRKSRLYDPAKAGAATWIFTIARNMRIDAFRRDKRPELDENDPALVPDAERPADQTLHSQEVAERLRDIIEELPDEQKTVVLMSFYQDKAHAAIAEELNIPLGTVKSRLRLAMSKIRGVWGTSSGVTL